MCGKGRKIPFASLILLHFDLSMHDISNAIKTFISFTLFLSVKHGAIQTCSSAVSNSTSMLKLNHFLSYRFRYQAISVVIRNYPHCKDVPSNYIFNFKKKDVALVAE